MPKYRMQHNVMSAAQNNHVCKWELYMHYTAKVLLLKWKYKLRSMYF